MLAAQPLFILRCACANRVAGGLNTLQVANACQSPAWGLFLGLVASKAEYAGKHAVPVDPRGTSQECPDCGRVAPKSLRERTHACSCGLVLDRDEAAARVILARALRVVGANACGGSDLCGGGAVLLGKSAR